MSLLRILIGFAALLLLALVAAFAPVHTSDNGADTGTKPATAVAGTQSMDTNRFFACTRDDECVVIEGECPGKVAINKAFRAEAEAHFAAVRPLVDCAGPDPRRKQPDHAVCTAQRCRLLP